MEEKAFTEEETQVIKSLLRHLGVSKDIKGLDAAFIVHSLLVCHALGDRAPQLYNALSSTIVNAVTQVFEETQ